MSKSHRKKYRHNFKQDKRILKLLYRTGLLEEYHIPIDEIYWDTLRRIGNKGYKYIQTPCHCTFDYWGECDDYCIIDRVMECLFYANVDRNPMDFDEEPRLVSSVYIKTREQLIDYLKSLPVKKSDSKINKTLKLDYNM